jgi:hypothetical protein
MNEEIRRQIRGFLHQIAPNFKERQAITELATALLSRLEAAEARAEAAEGERDGLKAGAAAIKAEHAAPIQGPEHGAWDRGRRAGLSFAVGALIGSAKP